MGEWVETLFSIAMSFAQKHDDGVADAESLKSADVVLIGVSGSGKSTICKALAMHHCKAANIPLVDMGFGMQAPYQLAHVDAGRVFCITMDAAQIRRIRSNRWGKEASRVPESYKHAQSIVHEVEAAEELFAAHPEWTVIDVTHKTEAENAHRICEMLQERKLFESHLLSTEEVAHLRGPG